jgi:ABC-type dipeptide/oligopeptide/nickel transport system permease subunit
MLTCTIMGYLSVGITPPTPEWGAIVHEVRGYVLTNPIMTILPCLVVSITLISFSLFGDGVRDALDPHE